MINMVNKYALDLDILAAQAAEDYPDIYLIESEYGFYEVFAIDMIQKLYDVLEEYVEEGTEDNILYKDYTIIKDYLELYKAMN